MQSNLCHALCSTSSLESNLMPHRYFMAFPADSTRCKQMQPDYLMQVLPLLTYFYIILLSVACCFLNGSFSCPHKLSVKNTIVGGVCHRGTASLILKLSQRATFLLSYTLMESAVCRLKRNLPDLVGTKSCPR